MHLTIKIITIRFWLILALLIANTLAFGQSKTNLGEAHNFQLFNQVKPSVELRSSLDTACNKYLIAETNNAFWNALIEERPSSLEFKVPTANGELIAEVSAISVVTSDFILQEWANGVTTPRTFNAGLYYRGKFKHDPNSSIAISFFENGQIMGVAFSKNWPGNLVIGRAKTATNIPFSNRPIIIYNDNQLRRKNNFNCATPDTALTDVIVPQNNPELPQGLTPITCKVVRMYLEAGTTVYTELGSNLTATTNYVTGLMNVISLVFDNEQLAVVLSRLQVNSTNDNVPVTGSDVVLDAFSTRMGTTTSFTEPIGHYLTANRGLGGLAYVGILCSSRSFRTGMSDIDETYSELPTYSWSVNVMSHELGHNLGSRHTQWCGWQISPTIRRQIDSCYNSETAPGGTCYTGPNIGRVGTIMSYCHLTGSVDLALGFGPLPGATIRSGVSGASCISNGNISTPTIAASGSTTICTGDSVTLTATGGIKYIWSNGATTSSIVVKTGGTFRVNALLGTCRSPESNAITVNVIAAPTVPTISANRSTNLCSGETVRLSSSIASNNQWFKDGSIISGATSSNYTVTTAGNYQVRQGPNANNCFSMSLPTMVNIGFIDRTNTATTSVNNVCAGTSVQLRSNRTIGLNSTFSNNNPVTISATGTPTVQSVISVPTSYTITNQDTIVIGVNMLHTYLGDITLNLISPFGTRITLFNRQGSSNDNLTNTRFSNFLGSPLNTGTAPYNGIFTPSGNLGSFVNQNLSGNWTLEVVDNANADGGELQNWYFQIKTRSQFAGFRWSVLNGAQLDSAATMNVTPSTTTSYVLTKTSLNGCTDKDTVTVTISNLARPTISAGGPITFCTGGSVVLTSSATTGNLWSNGATSRTITVNSSGTYTVRQISGTCTSAVSTGTTVTLNPLPTVNVVVEGANPFCIGTGSVLRANASNGTSFSYQWLRNSAAITGANGVTYTATSSGSYTVRVINQNACTTTSSAVSLTGTTTPTTPTISGNNSFCAGGNTVLTSSATTGNLWSNGATTRTITVSNAGNYSVRVISGICTSAVSSVFGVTETPLPTTPTISGNNSFCTGGNTVLNSSATTGNLWSNGATTRTITVSNAGNYSVRVISGTCTSAVSNTVAVTQTPLPNTPTISGNSTFCTGGNTVLTSSATTGNLWSNGATTQSITVSSAGNYSVRVISGGCTSAVSNTVAVTATPLPTTPTISGNNTFCAGESTVLTSSVTIGNLWSNGATTQSITVSSAGNYSVRVISGTCTSAVSSVVAVTETPLPTTPTISGNNSYCAGENTVLTSSATTGNLWSNGTTTQSITVSNAGNYSVRVISGTCTSLVSSVIAVTETPLPTTPTISGNNSFCFGENTVLTSSATTGNLWSNGATTQSITVSSAGNYSVRVISGGCTSAVSSTVAITETPLPTTPTIAGNNSFCFGESTILTSSSNTGNLWSNGATTQSITVSNAGNYSVRVISGSCTSAVSSVIAVIETPLPSTPTITGNNSFCAGENTVLTSSATTGNLWSNGATTQSITVNIAGNYSVRVITGGCTSAVSSTVAVTETPLPTTPTISGNNSFCAGESTVLTSSATTGNIWSNGATTQRITVSSAGNYSVRVISGTCTSAVSSTVPVTETPLPTTPTIAGNNSFCFGESTVLTSSATTGNLWSNGATTQSITVNSADDYSVRVISGGCTSAVSVVIAVTEISLSRPQVAVSSTNIVSGDSAVLSIINPNAGSEYLWSNGIINTRLVVRSNDTLTVQERLSSCLSEASMPIIITNGKANIDTKTAVLIYPNPAFNLVNVTTSETVTLRFYSTEGKLVKQTSLETSGSIDVTSLAAGLYQVVVNSANGQSAIKLVVK